MAAVRSLMTAVGAAVDGARDAARRECDHGSPGGVDIRVAATGGYALALESQEVMRRDLIRNITVSVVLVLSLLVLSWRSARIFFAAGAALTAGMVGGFGLFTMLREEIVTLALLSGAILAAIAIDFSIHLAEPLRGSRWSNDRRSVLDAVRLTGHSLLLAALTTVAGFGVFGMAGGGFLRDMGVLTACGIGATFLATVMVFPAVLALFPEPAAGAAGGAAPRSLAGRLATACGSLPVRRPRATLVLTGAVVVVAVAGLVVRPPRVEQDLRRIHAADSAAIATQERLRVTFGVADDPVLLLLSAGSGSTPAARESSPGGSARPDGEIELIRRLEDLDAHLARLLAAGDIAGWSSPSQLLPADRYQRRVLDLLKSLDRDQVIGAFDRELEAAGFAPEGFDAARERLLALLERRSPLAADDLRKHGFGEHLDAMLSCSTGECWALVAVYPEASAWEPRARERLLRQLTAARDASGLAGSVTGLYAASLASAEFVVGEFLRATAIALGAVALLVFGLFRHPVLSLCAMTPVLLGALVLAFLWGGLDLRINFMNAGILPMVIGIGVDDGIHLVARYARRPDGDVMSVVRSTGAAVVLTSVTTLLAFGTLAFSESRGLASVGWLSALGVVLCLVASLFVLPALLEVHRRGRRP
jgi:predicted RND superfamily exporter protein